MSIADLLQTSITNLLRRKLRTLLTVLGVVVGTASIVVMLSLGLGLQRSSLKQIEESGGITTITVYPTDGALDENGKAKKPVRLTDESMAQIATLPHVKVVSPVLQVDVLAKTGRYQANFSIKGMTTEALRDMNMKIGQGSLPKEEEPLQLFWGNLIAQNFYSAKSGDETPDIKPMTDTIFYIFDTDAYYSSQNNSSSADGNTQRVKAPKKYLLPVCGVLAGNPDEYSNNSFDVFAELGALKEHVKKAFKNKAIPGQPTRKNNKPYRELYYNSLYVRVDEMNAVEDVQKAIREMGLDANSNMEWLKQMQQQMRTIQMVLGGIGAVSLFVATIGIANTMMMSIYERTKEIGIFKVLGCDLADIRKIFLLEAGTIGLAGGAAGLVLSYAISTIINYLAQNSGNGGISYIPFWLTLLALFFSVFIGMMAGLMPALRAMHLSPLAALRNE